MDKEDKKENIHPAITLLVKRVESNPEEFICGKWSWVDMTLTKHLNNEEIKVYNAALRKLHMQRLHEAVMKQILDPQPEQGDLFANPQQQVLTPYQQAKKLIGVP